MGKWRMLLLAAIAAQFCIGHALPTGAADLGAGRPAVIAENAREAIADYLRRRAVLLMIRATFDLLLDEEIPRVLAADLARVGAGGPTEEALARLDRDLLAEGSYYLVSLRYLAEVGGAVWPSDRPESSYTAEALTTLDALQDRLVETVLNRTDPLPVLIAAQDILALTEGFVAVPERLDHFAGRDAVVERVLAEHGLATNT